MEYWDELERHVKPEEFWMSHALIRRDINQRVTGDPDVWPMDWFSREFGHRFPLERVLSVGCGQGSLERDLASRGIAQHVTAIDRSPRAIDAARSAARTAGFADSITYEVADAWQHLRGLREWDAIFFHASLHHFDRLSEFMRLVGASLRNEGLLYIDEYVGPAMNEWTWWRLGFLNLVYYLLPRRARRVRIIRTPRNPDDPTEAVESSRIIPAINESFAHLERRDYGGNVTALLYPNMTSTESPARARAVRQMLAIEHVLLDIIKVRSYHTVLVARPQR